MFTNFFFMLRKEGVPVTLVEWVTLMEALQMGLADASLMTFYNVSRAVLVKSETHFDQYDVAFSRCFAGIGEITPKELHKQVEDWFKDPKLPRFMSESERLDLLALLGDPDLEKLREGLEDRLRTQEDEHHKGTHWIGSAGSSPFGNFGVQEDLDATHMRIGGKSHGRIAVKVSAERQFKGYRADETIGIRQFELALRRLRSFSSRLEGPKDELDLNETIDATCKNAGALKLVWDRPRKNTVKLLVLMDEGGSMSEHALLCNRLFSAVHKSTHFKDIRFYYFHNCVYDFLFDAAAGNTRKAVPTHEVLNQFGSDYKVIMVGDATMAPSELLVPHGILSWENSNEEPGLTWLERVAKRFPYSVWLNPLREREWEPPHGARTVPHIRKVFPMYELTLEGLEKAIKKLMVRK